MNTNNIVTFSSLEFIFRFLPFFLAVFYLAPFRYRKIVLFLGSLLFYGLGEPFFLPLLLGLTVINYWIGNRNASMQWKKESSAERNCAKQRRRKRFFAAVGLNVGILCIFKLFGPLHGWFPGAVFWEKAAEIGLPLGLSFYLFKMLSYQADCYRGELTEHTFLDAAVYFCMFPQVVSGPIMRFGSMQGILERNEKKGREQRLRQIFRRLEEGLFYFTAGLGAKVLLADRLGILWHELATIGYESISTPLAWIGAFAYSMQLYFDFAGYSLMAAGIGVMIGLPFVHNFEHPYAADSVRDFFRRWHMTLGSWFRDYVYIPLGGNRKGRKRCILNLAFVWLLTGLWHGVTVNFLIWGMLLFGLIASEKMFLGPVLERHKIGRHIYVILVMPVTWMVFAITQPGQLGIYLGRMFPFLESLFGRAKGVVNTGDFIKYGKQYALLFMTGIICCLPPVVRWVERRRHRPLVAFFMTVVFWSAICLVTNAVSNPFLYFSF